MRVIVLEPVVPVSVAVCARERWIVNVRVVAVVVAMGVLVFDGFVRVPVPVPLGEVEVHGKGEGCRRDRDPRATVAVAKCERDGGPHERRERKERACPRSPEHALGAEVKA